MLHAVYVYEKLNTYALSINDEINVNAEIRVCVYCLQSVLLRNHSILKIHQVDKISQKRTLVFMNSTQVIQFFLFHSIYQSNQIEINAKFDSFSTNFNN